MIENVHKNLEKYVEKYNVMTLSVFICLVTLFFSMPPFDSVIIDSTWEVIFKQIKDPFLPIEAPSWSHNSKLTFRLFPVLLGKVLFLNKTGFLVLLYFVGFLIIYFTFKFLNLKLGDKYNAFLLTLAFSFVYAGKMSFLEFRGIFDGIALLLLIFSIYSKNVFIIFFSIFFSAFTDERALITSGFIFIYYFFVDTSFKSKSLISIVLAWLSYFVIRYLLIIFFSFKTSIGGISMSILALNFEFFPLSIYSSLEGFWFLVLLSFFYMYSQNRISLYLHILMIFVFLIPCYLVIDVSRSLSYLTILIFTLTAYLKNQSLLILSKRDCTIILILSLFFPTYIMGGDQITWVKPILLEYLFRFFTNS